ncbi:YggS family pyridoxal phosphate-dependent enzyme [Brumimicrobium aurantiacum]|uniref:Pyridoxal phosphate homeostasis protein n=1 Tax=Brumimicrobium aurantiacum TaxID=1737063 RepID=A0A3E1EW98_9FLAO|nr:YggS family pyridoxal phosphate-dependent enzyme [Brumimicrobium aurantiacum]RFC53831.1 YggS family pyridoxal phosphate-dependent enzyme [Brumimicrobium aurantiacum]
MIAEKLSEVKSNLPQGVTLVAVSKTKPNEDILAAYEAGQRIFGENRVQELVDKYEALPKDIEWHMIGHLQTKKVKYIAPFVSLIHGVDSFKLLEEINKRAKKEERTIDVLLQFHIAQEQSKYGFDFDEAKTMLESQEFTQLENINVRGVMGMATFTENEEKIQDEFRTLNNYFEIFRSHFFKFNKSFEIISMGMSGDYKIAIEEGSNMVRIGSTIFGSRN